MEWAGTKVKSIFKNSGLTSRHVLFFFNVFLEREWYTTSETLLWYSKIYLWQTYVMFPTMNKLLVNLVMALQSILQLFGRSFSLCL